MNASSKAVLGLILASLFGGTAWAQDKIGTIDLNRAFSRYVKTQKLSDIIKEEQDKDEKSLKETADKVAALEKEYRALAAKADEDAKNIALAQGQKEKSAKAANDKLVTLQGLQREFEDDRARYRVELDQKRERGNNKIFDEVRSVVSAQAKLGGYSMVIDISAKSVTGAPVILYMASTNNDLTEKVLEDLNRAANALLEEKPAAKQP